MKKISMILLAVVGLILSGCGPKGFVRGSYDEDVNATNLLTDKWSESDMQNAVKDLVGKASNHYMIRTAKKPPIVMITRIQNKTSEHIDTQSIGDMMRVELMNSSGLQFVDKEARQDIAEEYDYQGSGMVNRQTRKGPGGQIGADFILNGRLDSIVQQAGKDKTVYYKLTLNMTNLKTGIIVWSGYKQIRKVYRKQTVGL
ncbi:MAG: penicillin-binding protein activator LpoB [Bdellovibrionaceae bacterium]|nr:penicillin-binding protein activator LpoB [Pseudobdellovibrionaceae bacterium]|tara:strand:+ start:42124 stop:42723 length:600 start_codon:yes stop_codon:yes gene_type:complete